MKNFVLTFCIAFFSFFCCAVEIIPEPCEMMEDHGIAVVNSHSLEVITSAEHDVSAVFASEMLKKHVQTLPRMEGRKIRLHLAKTGDSVFAGTPLENVILRRPQEYVLRFVPRGDAVDIYGAGADSPGVFYAAVTLKQLLLPDGLHMRDIHDYPEWKLRYIGGYHPITVGQMVQLADFKINGYGIQHRYDWRRFGPEERPLYAKKYTYRQYFEQIRDFRESSGELIDFMMMINVYCGKRLDASREEDLELLIRQCRFAADYVQEIMIQFDDETPMENNRYVFVSDGEKKMFRNPGHSHGYIVRRVADALRQERPGVRISVCPAPYSLNNHNAASPSNRAYLDSMSRELPEHVRIVWTGVAVESASVTAEDYRKYQKLVNGGSCISGTIPPT